jgi:hypothetical protein
LPVDEARKVLLRQLAKHIEMTMPGNTGFVLLVYGQGPLATQGELLQYVSNSRREDVTQLLKEWLATVTSDSDYDRDLAPGQTDSEQHFEAWWQNRLERGALSSGPESIREWCQDAWNAGRASLA